MDEAFLPVKRPVLRFSLSQLHIWNLVALDEKRGRMREPDYYNGIWPENIRGIARYALKLTDEKWNATILYETAEGVCCLPAKSKDVVLTARLGAFKSAHIDDPGRVLHYQDGFRYIFVPTDETRRVDESGRIYSFACEALPDAEFHSFYVNEFRHILFPVLRPEPSYFDYFCVGKLEADIQFEFEAKPLTTRPVHQDGTPLKAGERWDGPWPGIPYFLAAGGNDIYCKTLLPIISTGCIYYKRIKRHIFLSRILMDEQRAADAAKPIAAVLGDAGGRFYVNEHGAIFAPIGPGNGDSVHYIFCGVIDYAVWFPDPIVSSPSGSANYAHEIIRGYV
jgi:hypothetical protein